MLNPLQPQLEPFDWALSWHGLAPLRQLASLMGASFPPPPPRPHRPAAPPPAPPLRTFMHCY